LILLAVMIVCIGIAAKRAISKEDITMWVYAIGYSVVLVLIIVYHITGGRMG
jgi:hypothetical protein